MRLLSSCTQNAIKAIKSSGTEAKRLNNDFVGSEHLILGILNQSESIAAGALNKLNVTPKSFLLMTLRITSPSQESYLNVTDFPINEEGKRILENALSYTNSKQKLITTEHLLMGILNHESCIAVNILQKLLSQNIGSIRENIYNLIEGKDTTTTESYNDSKPKGLTMQSNHWIQLGKNAKLPQLSDTQLVEQIVALSKVVSYFVGRNDSQPLVTGLITEGMALENMARFRGLELPPVLD